MSRHKKTHKKSAFLLKTYEILQNETFQDIISWSSDGVGFIVHNTAQFAENILPIYFKHSNFHSFIRQLNMYGFSKKKTPKIENYYYNAKFCKGQGQLIGEIQRRVEKKNPKHSENQKKFTVTSIKEEASSSEKNISEFSIELQSKQEEEDNISIEHDEQYDKICFQLYTLMKVNNLLLNQQVHWLSEIISDFKTPSEEKNEVQKVFREYICMHSRLRQQLLIQSQREIKNSEKYIKSLSVLETESGLPQKISQK